jgi:DNA-binding NarL/FixJ family response regulator
MGKPQTEKQHIHNAIASLAKAQSIMSKQLDRHEKILDSQAAEINDLQNTVAELRKCAIKADLAAGTPGIEVARRYGVTPGRISQIKHS